MKTFYVVALVALVHSFCAATAIGFEVASLQDFIEQNEYFKKLPVESQKFISGIVDEISSATEVVVTFDSMSTHRKQKLMLEVSKWLSATDSSNLTEISHNDIKEHLRRSLSKYYFMPQYSVTEENLGHLEKQKEMIFQSLNSALATVANDDSLEIFCLEVSQLYDRAISNDFTPILKYPLPEHDFNNMLDSLATEIPKINPLNISSGNNPNLVLGAVRVFSIVEQFYSHAVPKEVLDEAVVANNNVVTYFKPNKAERLIAEQRVQMAEHDRLFFEEFNRKAAMIALEETSGHSANAEEIVVTRSSMLFYRLIFISAGVILIFIAIWRKVRSIIHSKQ